MIKLSMKDIADSHRFFIRESQHYVLGNWSIYVPFRKKIKYYLRYPMAYLRFMWLGLKGDKI